MCLFLPFQLSFWRHKNLSHLTVIKLSWQEIPTFWTVVCMKTHTFSVGLTGWWCLSTRPHRVTAHRIIFITLEEKIRGFMRVRSLRHWVSGMLVNRALAESCTVCPRNLKFHFIVWPNESDAMCQKSSFLSHKLSSMIQRHFYFENLKVLWINVHKSAWKS